jgi:DNA-directed RNA polymerase specialized sigma24 family protein
MSVDDVEFREFFAAQYARLCWLGLLLTGDQAEAEELAQEALVRTWWRWVVHRPEGSPWPDEHGAFDQFLRRRTRRGRALAGRGALAVVVALALAAGLPPPAPQPPGGAGDPAGHGAAAPDARRRLRGARAHRLDRPEPVPEGHHSSQ